MDYMRWMTLNTKIHTKKLANICLPMTHDSGTFDLSDEMAPDPAEWIVELENTGGDRQGPERRRHPALRGRSAGVAAR